MCKREDFYRVDQGDELDEFANLLDFDGFEAEESNKDCSTVTKEPLRSSSDLLKNTTENLTAERANNSTAVERSEIHNGDTDSSDDEDNRFAGDHQNYTDSGRSIKSFLKKSTSSEAPFDSTTSSWKSKKVSSPANQPCKTPSESITSVKAPLDIYSDPYFGIRIITPLISSQSIREKMTGKTAVPLKRLEKHLATYDKSSDWVMAGVILSKNIKTSQKGNPYVCWTLSDLRDDLLTVTVFLFGKAYKSLWKTGTHTVVAILNASPLDHTSKNNVATVSVLNPEQVMIWGQSKDLGVCKARKKNGEPCTSFVNTNQCAFCVYHVKQEYRKFTGRSELQAGSGGSLSGSLTQLRNKVLGKSEVFYAGKSFTAVQGKPTQKQKVKDQKRLTDLFSSCESRLEPCLQSKKAPPTQSNRVLLIKVAERLQKITGSPATLAELQQESMGLSSSSTSTPSNPASKITSENLSKPNGTKTSIPTSTLSSNKAEKNGSETRLGKPSKRTEMLNNPSVKKPSHIANSRIQKSQSVRSPSSQGSSLTNLNKKVPTKNRFDNLTKLKSLHGNLNNFKKGSSTKENENDKTSSVANKKDDKFICSSNQLKGIDMFDVSFDFGEENNSKGNESNVLNKSKNSKLFENIHKSVSKKESQDSTFSKHSLETGKQSSSDSQGSIQFKTNDTVLSPKTNNGLSSSYNSPTQLTNSHSNKTPLTNPLSEIKLSAKYECDENSVEKHSNWTSKVQPNGRRQKPDEVSLSPEIPMKKLKDVVHTNSPKLSEFGSLSVSVPVRQSSAKAKALKYVRQKGPIKKEDTNSLNGKPLPLTKKRKITEDEESSKGKESVMSKVFLELINASSAHTDLISKAEDEAMDEYYEKMEKKEKMEEKMLSTYKVECKAYRCLKCKYKWFAPSDLCKAEGHPLKVVSAVKRFFQCHNCKNRTVSLDLIPLHSCKNCGQNSWDRAPMMRERKMTTTHLSIRGGEQKFFNSVVTDTNLDLVMPDD